MSLTLLADRQYTAPSAANAASITPSGTAWANSAYVTVLASTPSACVLTGVLVNTSLGEGSSSFYEFEVDIATGAAGAEVAIATVRGCNSRSITGSAGGPSSCWVLPIPIDNIASGVRLSARMRKSGTSTTAHKVAVTYLQKPLTASILTTAVPQITLPAAASGVTVTAGASWVSGSWQQLRAASGAALVVTGICGRGSSATNDYELDLGTGTAGSETVITTLRVRSTSAVMPGMVMLPTPLDAIPAATRLAARLRCPTASATMVVSLMVVEKPL